MTIENRNILMKLSQDFLSAGNQVVFTAKGRSMTPFIRHGDNVLIKPCSAVYVGDVVLFRSLDSSFVMHRVVKKERDGIITRGDACMSNDGLINCEDIIGKVVHIEGRITSMFLCFPLGYLLALGLRLRKYPRLFHPLKGFIGTLFFSR